MSGFNFFKILEKGDKELVHSAMLAYLIGKYEGFNTNFLGLPNVKEESIELEKSFRYTELVPDYKRRGVRFDIFCKSTDEKEVVVIENKFKSAPEKGQLEEYNITLDQNLSEVIIHKILFCFDKSLAIKVVEDKTWKVFDYVDLLEELATGKYNGNSDAEKLFVEHYCTLLKEYIDHKVAFEKDASTLFKRGLDNDQRFWRRLFNAKLYLELVNDEQFIDCGYALNPGNVSDPLLNIVPAKWITAFGFKLLIPFQGKELLLQLQGEDLKFYLHLDKENKDVEKVNAFLGEVRKYFNEKLDIYNIKDNVEKLPGSMFICKVKVKSNVVDGIVTVETVKNLIGNFYKECDAFLTQYQEEKNRL